MGTGLWLVVIAVVIFAVWKLRSLYELRQTAEFKESQRLEREQLGKTLDQLRELSKKPSPTHEELCAVVGYGDLVENDLAVLKTKFRWTSTFAEIGTSVKEVDRLLRGYVMQVGWASIMETLQTTDYDEGMFNYNLRRRLEFLQKHGKTLSDFGITSDDSDDLRRAFYLRLARHVRERAIDQLNKLEIEVARLRTPQFVPSVKDDDFGLTEVRLRLDRLLTLK